MPSAPLRPCAAQPCPNLVARGRCDQHARATSTGRGYDARWQRFRRWYIAEYVSGNPTCLDCSAPFMRMADIELHHEHKAVDHPELLFETENIRALCKRCHSVRTKRGE